MTNVYESSGTSRQYRLRRSAWLRSMPLNNAPSSAAVISRRCSAHSENGIAQVPFSSRLAHTANPFRSQYRILTRSFLRLAHTLLWKCCPCPEIRGCFVSQAYFSRKAKKKPRFFPLASVVDFIAAAGTEHRLFYGDTAETGFRSGELAGMCERLPRGKLGSRLEPVNWLRGPDTYRIDNS